MLVEQLVNAATRDARRRRTVRAVKFCRVVKNLRGSRSLRIDFDGLSSVWTRNEMRDSPAKRATVTIIPVFNFSRAFLSGRTNGTSSGSAALVVSRELIEARERGVSLLQVSRGKDGE